LVIYAIIGGFSPDGSYLDD